MSTSVKHLMAIFASAQATIILMKLTGHTDFNWLLTCIPVMALAVYCISILVLATAMGFVIEFRRAILRNANENKFNHHKP